MYLQSFCYADQYSKASQMCTGTLNWGSILLNDVNISHHPIIGPASIPNSMMQNIYPCPQALSLSLSILHTETSTCDNEILTQRGLIGKQPCIYHSYRKALETWLYTAAHNLRVWEPPVDTMIVVVRDIILSGKV